VIAVITVDGGLVSEVHGYFSDEGTLETVGAL
jgi:hypothetical protein